MPTPPLSERIFLHWLQELNAWHAAEQMTSSREAARQVLGAWKYFETRLPAIYALAQQEPEVSLNTNYLFESPMEMFP